MPAPGNTGRDRQRLIFDKAHAQSRSADKTCRSFSERHLSTRCGGQIFCRTYPCVIAEKPVRRGLTQSSSVTNTFGPRHRQCYTCLGHAGRRGSLRSPGQQDLPGKVTEWRQESRRGLVRAKRGCPTISVDCGDFIAEIFEPPHAREKYPLIWIGCVDDAANMLGCLVVHKTEVMLRRQIVRHLTNEYDAECRALLEHRDLPRNGLEEILRDRFADTQAAKPAGR